MSLTEQQKKFIEHYLSNNFDAFKAARAAGYRFKNLARNAHKILENANILKALKEELSKRAQTFQLDRTFVLANLIKTVNICLATYIDDEGFECFKFPTLVDKGLKCIEKIGKHLGMFDQHDNDKGEMPEINVINGIDNDEI